MLFFNLDEVGENLPAEIRANKGMSYKSCISSEFNVETRKKIHPQFRVAATEMVNRPHGLVWISLGLHHQRLQEGLSWCKEFRAMNLKLNNDFQSAVHCVYIKILMHKQ